MDNTIDNKKYILKKLKNTLVLSALSNKNMVLKVALQRRYILCSLVLVLFANVASAQFFSPANIRSVDVSSLSNNDIEKIKNEMDKQNMSIETAESLALSNGMSAQNFSILKTRLAAHTPQAQPNVSNVEKGTEIKEQVIELDKNAVKQPQIFGSEFFTNASLSFEPNTSLATPASYVLGVGDELQLEIYGMQIYSGSFSVSKEGFISIPVVGQVYVNGLNFDAAKSKIKNECQKVYPSLATGASQFSLTLSKIKTIRITIIGARKPGNYSVSSLSTVFNALHIAGGPDGNGSYRNIELVRNNKVVKVIDIYRFLTTGNQEGNVNLEENDVINIPVYQNRVKIEGHVKRPGIFELLPNETFEDLLKYAGGFDEAAYRKNIKLVQNSEDGTGIKVFDLTEDKYKNYKPQLGDVFKVASMLAKFENKVSVRGAVYRPDDYEFTEGMTVESLLEKADGVTEDAYLIRALLIREKADLTKEITYVNITDVLSGKDSTLLRKNDELVVSSLFDIDSRSKAILQINGQVRNGGEFPYIENIRLYDLILMAGGFTYGASRTVEVSSIIVRDEVKGQSSKMSEIKTFEIDTLLIDQTNNILLNPYDVVTVRKKPVFETQKTITVKGEVEYPGIYTVSDKLERVLDIINRTGGPKHFANLEGIRVVRNRSGKELVIPIDWEKINKKPDDRQNIEIEDGDILIVPEQKRTVVVLGTVQLPSEIPYFSKRLKRYINASGGFDKHAYRKKVYVIQPNGLAEPTRSFLGIPIYPKVKTGATIIVPYKDPNDKGDKMSTGEWAIIASIITGLTSSAAMTTVALTR